MKVGDWEVVAELVAGVPDVVIGLPVYAEAPVIVLAPAPDRAVVDDGAGVGVPGYDGLQARGRQVGGL